jgi:predicted transcriptional regulator
MLTPQEIQVWYILPAIRKAIALKLKEKNFQQKDIAKIMDLTPAAVSQYLHKKRAKLNVNIDPKTIEIAVNHILKKDMNYHKVLQEVIAEVTKNHTICKVHKEIETIKECCGWCKK